MRLAVLFALLVGGCSTGKSEAYPAALECVSKYATYMAVLRDLSGKVPTPDMMSVGATLWERALSLGHEAGKTEAEISADLDRENRMRGELLNREQPTVVPDRIESEAQSCLSELRSKLPG